MVAQSSTILLLLLAAAATSAAGAAPLLRRVRLVDIRYLARRQQTNGSINPAALQATFLRAGGSTG